MMIPRTILIALYVVALPLCAIADTVSLRDGRQFRGKIVAEDQEAIQIDTVVAEVRATLRFTRNEVASIDRSPVSDNYFAPQPTTRRAQTANQTAPPRTADAELQAWRERISAPDAEAIEQRKADLRGLEGKYTAIARSRSSQSIKTEERKELQLEINEVERDIASLRHRVEATKAGSWQELRPRIQALQQEDRRLELLRMQFDTPEKAADVCVQDLIRQGVIKTATRLKVSNVDVYKTQWALSSGQWATAPYGVGIVAPGAAFPILPVGLKRRPGARGQQVWYAFSFVTQAGLLREHEGWVMVANADGFWEPFGYNVDGLDASPYKGREKLQQELNPIIEQENNPPKQAGTDRN